MVKYRPRKGAKKILKHFFDNTTIHACNFFSMDSISIYEKIFWALINIATITLTILWIYHLWLWYEEDSTFVNFDGTISLTEVDHPAIAICNVNKISKKRAYKFAKELAILTKEKNITALMEDIKLIGNLYNFNIFGQERFKKVQELLDKYDNLSSLFDPTRRILELTTPCEEMLHKCRWDSQDYSCHELFLTRMTFDGFCCVFNYIRPSERESLYKNRRVPTEPEMFHNPGISYGLEIILNNDVDDYFYTTMETTGYKVHFFLCKDFPDVLSGSLKEFLVDVRRQNLFNIEVDVIKSTPQIKSVPIRSRKCLFESEANTTFGTYRQSDCFVDCKLRSMQALCNCVPFIMPIHSRSSKYPSVCTLMDIPCVNQYFRKWTKYYPKDTEIEDLELEIHDSLNCDCLPTCDGVNYNVYTNTFPIENTDRNISKINIFFNKPYGNLYKIDMTFTWFEIISAYGGLMSLIMGLSLISIVEVIHLFFKLILYYGFILFQRI